MPSGELNPVVMDHFLNPRNTGELLDATVVVTSVNSRCGDVLKLWARIEGGIVRDVRAKTFGCAVAIAATSVLTEMIKGLDVSGAAGITNGDIVRRLGGVPPDKELCSVLAEDAVQKIVDACRGAGGAPNP